MSQSSNKEFAMAVGTSSMLEPNMMEGENFYTPMETSTQPEPEPEPEQATQNNWSNVKNDTGQLCRACANTSDYLIPIFEGEGLEHQLETKITKHLPIQVTATDTLPLQLCYQCASTLIAWDTMINSCIEADKKLRAMQEAAGEEIKDTDDFDSSHIDNDTIDSDDEPLITSKAKLAEKKKVPIKKKILSKAKSKNLTVKNDKTASDSKEGEEKERSGRRSKTKKRIPTPLTKVQIVSEDGRIACKSCTLKFEKPFDLTDHLFRSHSRKVYHCHLCDRVYETEKFVFFKHVREHLDKESVHTCTECSRKFRKEKNLYKHRAVKHEKSKNYQCDSCDMSFEKYSHFKKHCVQAHERSPKPGKADEKGHTCHLCGKQFSHSTGLSYHLKHVHEGIKEHGCDICGRKFALKAAMEDHRRIHTGERPFVCHACGKSFKAKASLYIHSKTHTDSFPYPCNYCERRFRWRQQLLGHITTHTGEKKHFCENCGKGFGVKNDLTRHKLVHSQEKPFLCLVCGMAFGQKRYLKNHEKTRHKKEGVV